VTLSPSDIGRLLREHGLRPSRALGQHFVADPNTVRRIARLAGATAGSRVVEIGAGLGSLTVALAATGATVVAVEVDRHLVPVLRTVVSPYPDVRVVEADALALDWDGLLGPVDPGRPWLLVANLPYNVATPLVVRVLEEAPHVRSMLVMVQREVGERLAAGPGDKVYGAVSVKVAYWATSAVVGLVPPTVFVPKPAVDSALVRIDRRAEPAVPETLVTYDRLFAVVGAGFSQRRKMLRHSLAGVVAPAAFAVAGVAPQARAEELDVEQWGRLAAWRATGTTATGTT
jgi:16S rRNA (adenine1518-N6/adenine1519-N6)-dimethyltransferase